MGDRRGQAGFSLLEVLLSIALSGIVVGAIAGAMLTLSKLTVVTSKHQKVSAAVASFSESVKSLDYLDCAGGVAGSNYSGAATADSLGVDSVKVVSVAYWQNDTGDGSGQGSFVDAHKIGCDLTAPTQPVAPAPSVPTTTVNPAAPVVLAAAATNPAEVDQGAQLITIEVRFEDVVQRSTVAKRRP